MAYLARKLKGIPERRRHAARSHGHVTVRTGGTRISISITTCRNFPSEAPTESSKATALKYDRKTMPTGNLLVSVLNMFGIDQQTR